MNIFLLKRDCKNDGQGEYDTVLGYIIVALNEQEARQYGAAGNIGEANATVWFAETTTCKDIGVANESIKPGVILKDYISG